jgi:sugar (pentulose or hexulose) kinase
MEADVLRVPVVVPSVTESALLGEAMLAAEAAGRASDATAAGARFLRESARFDPDRDGAPAYERAYLTYRELTHDCATSCMAGRDLCHRVRDVEENCTPGPRAWK